MTNARTHLPRVLHVCSDTNIGGAGRYVLTLLTHPRLAERFAVAAACPEGALAAALRRAGVTVFPYPGADRSLTGPGLWHLYRIMRRWRPHIVHTHGALSGRIAGRLAGVRVVYTKHGLAAAVEASVQVRSPGAWLRRLAVRRFADRIVAVSAAVRDALVAQGADPGAVRVIPGGVDLRAYEQVPPPVPGVVGALGRLEREKGFDVLLDAMAELRGEARLILGGDGSQRQALAARVEKEGLPVELTGFVADVPAFLGRTGVFVLPSRSEGLGLVAVEAMAAGRPVVATRVGGLPEVVVDGETGFLVEPEDPEALARAIRALLADPARAARMGAAGRERVRKLFSAERMAEATAALYEELIAP
ncbi:MAG: glycosyltransferase family 4 protein [Bacillota bacterium]|nr:MAG: glycosyltransferase [Bacillota bacterium]